MQIVKSEGFHPRNAHQGTYPMQELADTNPTLKQYLQKKPDGEWTIDFAKAEAVKALNQAILQKDYRLPFWDLPKGYLCPAVPSRADYLHRAADLLMRTYEIPQGKKVKVLDIGTGANCIYPLIGHQTFGWSFTGVDADSTAVRTAKGLCQANKLEKAIRIRLQPNPEHVLEGVIKEEELFDLMICNPPFHPDQKTAEDAAQRKWKKLGKRKDMGFNFRGQKNELSYPGGERAFINILIQESHQFADQCLWFTTLVAHKEHLNNFVEQLKHLKAKIIVKEQMHGQKISRILCWSFQTERERKTWIRELHQS